MKPGESPRTEPVVDQLPFHVSDKSSYDTGGCGSVTDIVSPVLLRLLRSKDALLYGEAHDIATEDRPTVSVVKCLKQEPCLMLLSLSSPSPPLLLLLSLSSPPLLPPPLLLPPPSPSLSISDGSFVKGLLTFEQTRWIMSVCFPSERTEADVEVVDASPLQHMGLRPCSSANQCVHRVQV